MKKQTTQKKQNNSKAKSIILAALSVFLLLIGFLALFAALWYVDLYGDVGFDSVIYTIFSDLGGTDPELIKSFVINALLPTILATYVMSLVIFYKPKNKVMLSIKTKAKLLKARIYPLTKVSSAVISLILAAAMIGFAAFRVNLVEYVVYMSQPSELYETYYADPSKTNIKFPEEKQNLIYIFLESVETTFYAENQGGEWHTNLIPELYQLAQNNTNFSQTQHIGGATALTGGTWTIGAMVSHTTGVPLVIPLGISNHNAYGQDSFLPGITSLSDVLHENGYYQALMVGSDAKFGGRYQFFTQHGTDEVFDLFTARADGITPTKNYKVFWGMEDLYLFEYAKQELTEIAKMDQPFAFTMLTVDTHFPNGYVCKYCKKDHANSYDNVYSCSSRQVAEFVNWIQAQDFYENTTIVICGDHPTMNNDYANAQITEGYERTMYNCFINPLAETDNTKNRSFCTLDMFPTVLAAIGCDIEGDRLGLGTNLFSKTPTLCEKLGKEQFDIELKKSSKYYATNFYLDPDNPESSAAEDVVSKKEK